ncbi:hypothetical protein V6N13_079484 [Hibiscus sabdariffa]
MIRETALNSTYMSSHSFNLCHLFRCSSPIPPPPISFPYNHQLTPFAGLPVVKWNEIVDDAIIEMEAFEDLKPNKIKEHVDNIKSMLGSMGDGEISCSAYDTAWVALIEDVNGSGSPQFPCTLQWIANNQLPDGSWSDGHVFLAHDRLINTLACVVALKTWNVHRDKYEKGVSFFKDNISKLGDESAEHMPIGFEVAFPSLLDIARTLNIEVPYDCPEFHHIYEQRDLKLTRHWTEEGICWARNTRVHNIDDTAMGFRLLRLHGYDVSADVFRHFEKGGEFFCFAGQSNSNQAVTGIFNLYRASQVRFPGDKILEDADRFSTSFLRQKQAAHQLLDKWIITKDLPGEVGYALRFPWHASLPRVETRFYIEQYGGEDDVWIGKTLYRMPYVNNNAYLELAKLDFNNCQALHKMEWNSMQKWYSEMGLGVSGVSRRSLLLTYFTAAASIFEPERSLERLAWAKTAFLVETIASSFDNGIIKPTDHELRETFVQVFTSSADAPLSHISGRKLDSIKTTLKLIDTSIRTLNQLSLDALVVHGRDISRSIRHAWEKWMLKWVDEGDRHRGVAELVVQMINLTSGYWSMEELMSHPQYERLSDLTNIVCHHLCYYQKQKVQDKGCFDNTDTEQRTQEIESTKQELDQLVLQNSSDDMDSEFKQTFLTVAQSFYYAAHCDLETTIYYIAKVLFEKVQ